MVGSRTLTALVGLIASFGLSAVLYVYTGSLLFFLFVPFIPFLFADRERRGDKSVQPPIRECPRCGFVTQNSEFDYCARDGSRLSEDAESER